MITAWILYAIVVGALLGAGGLALEKLLRTHGLPSRWLWAGTILLSFTWPLGHLAWENRPQEPPAVAPPTLPAVSLPDPIPTPLTLEPIAVEVSPESVLRLLDGPIVVTWALATGALFLFFTFLFFRTHHFRGQWRKGKAGGQAVLYSDEWGPAVVGFLRPQIVLPGWCQDIDEWALRFILDHELEHVRAGDLKLIILAGVIPVFFPWHFPIWWQLARLRTAVEGDCDLRVLGRNPGKTKSYVDLLLDVGERSARTRPMAAMLSEPYETLKRRIRIMTMPLPHKPWMRGVLLAGVGAVLVALACWAPGPTDAQDEDTASPLEAASLGDVGVAQGETVIPVFTPYSVRPSIRNFDEVVAALEREYPPLLKDAGIGGTVQVWLFIDEGARVVRVQVNESSGHKALDDAAIQVANVIEFTPALNRDQGRPVWISLPIEFTTSDGYETEVSERRPEVERTEERVATIPSDVATPVARQTGEITGTATDAATGVPLASVQVFVSGTGRGTLSNKEGRFLIRHVPVGEQEVVAQFIGYGQISEGLTVMEGEGAEVKFDLQPTAISLEKLVVKGTAKVRGGQTH